MRIRFLSVLLSSVLCASAVAAPASPESVEKLLVVTKAEDLVNSMYVNVDRMMRQMIQRTSGDKPLTADDQRRLDATLDKVIALMRDEMSWAKMKPQYMRIYEETFDQDEVDGLLAFYVSPAGQAMINKMPVVVQKSLAMSQAQMQVLMPKLMAIMKESTGEAPPPK